jgi:hypothetical protein
MYPMNIAIVKRPFAMIYENVVTIAPNLRKSLSQTWIISPRDCYDYDISLILPDCGFMQRESPEPPEQLDKYPEFLNGLQIRPAPSQNLRPTYAQAWPSFDLNSLRFKSMTADRAVTAVEVNECVDCMYK